MNTAATILLIAGGLLEASGFVMALLDLRDTRRRFAQYRQRSITIEPTPIRLRARAFGPTVQVDPPPPVEVRVERLEAQIAGLRDQMENQGDALVDRLREEIAETAGSLDRARQREDEAFSQLLEGVMIAGIPSRSIAVALFVGGLAAQVVSNFT